MSLNLTSFLCGIPFLAELDSQKNISEFLVKLLYSKELLQPTDGILWRAFIFAGALAAAFILIYLFRILYRTVFGRFAGKTKNRWDDLLIQNKVFENFIDIFPFYFAKLLLPILFASLENPLLLVLMQKVASVLLIVYIMRFAISALNYLHDLIEYAASHRNKPLAGFVQGVKIILVIIAVINIIAVLIDQNPRTLLLGLGASAAILTLIFKDTILGLVAGVQFSAYDMLRIGDWITMPKYNADGDVIEIGLNSIKVQNFDNTITTIPTYALVSDSFQNWRGMSESGGRRVKRSVSIDMRSVKFCTPEMLVRFGKIQLLSEYLCKKQFELEEYNTTHNIDNAVLVNGRRQTNLGVFRAYVEEYLRTHPQVNHKMTCMVRQLQPTEKGIPLELYFFTDDVRWIPYENIQSDVFDHILAIISHFDLHVFQNISGSDISSIGASSAKE